MRSRDFISVVVLSAVAALSMTQPSWAKHHARTQTVDSDPCAAPNAYVRERINRIKALQASAPKANGSLLDMIGGDKNFDVKRSTEISDLRNDADGVNALLAAGGCKAFDLNQELSQGAK
jgi:hypothetical protein